MSETADILIVGGGIIGVATALELQTRNPATRIVVLEKEAVPAAHQTGHNSGVIHAGVYYAPGSMKARFCREGVQTTEAFCKEHDVAFDRVGKLIVATDESELAGLQRLGERARENQIAIEAVDQVGVRQLEPHVNAIAALLSPTTGITNYRRITEVMADLFVSRGGVIHYGQRVLSCEEGPSHVRVVTQDAAYEASLAVTCAGLHSDRVIRAFGHEPGYRVIPFRGEYYRLANQPEKSGSTPDLPRPQPQPPLSWRASDAQARRRFYGRPQRGFWPLSARATGAPTSPRETWCRRLGIAGFGPCWDAMPARRRLSCGRPHSSAPIFPACSAIVRGSRWQTCSPIPRAYARKAIAPDGTIIDDFLFIRSERCLHVGNAPSPAGTSCIPIARHIADELAALS